MIRPRKPVNKRVQERLKSNGVASVALILSERDNIDEVPFILMNPEERIINEFNAPTDSRMVGLKGTDMLCIPALSKDGKFGNYSFIVERMCLDLIYEGYSPDQFKFGERVLYWVKFGTEVTYGEEHDTNA